MNRRGFTLIEMIITIAVMTFLVLATVPKLVNFYQKWSLDAYAQDLTSVVRLAQSKSVQGEDDAVYSVRLVTGAGGTFTMFQGTNFALRNTAYDEVYTLPSFLNLTETITGQDILFTRTEGSTTTTGTITLTYTDGGLSHGITINSLGTVDPF